MQRQLYHIKAWFLYHTMIFHVASYGSSIWASPSMSPVYFAEHCHYDNEEIAADVNCSSRWLLRELKGIRAGWQGPSQLMGGFFTVLAADGRGLDGSGCCEQHPSAALPVASPGWDWPALVRGEVSRSPFSSCCRDL